MQHIDEKDLLQRRDRLTAMFDSSRCVVVSFSVTSSVTELTNLSDHSLSRTNWAKKNPGGLAGDLSLPGLKIETWGTQIGDDAVSGLRAVKQDACRLLLSCGFVRAYGAIEELVVFEIDLEECRSLLNLSSNERLR